MAAIIHIGRRRASTVSASDPAKRRRPRKPKPAQTVASMATIMDDIGAPAGQRVVCPWPPHQLNPNARMHPAKRAPFAAKYRRDCWALTLEARMRAPATGRIKLRIDLFPPDSALRDDDNAISSFKAGRDGIADALKADDVRFVTHTTLHSEPLGCVVVTLLADSEATS